MKWVDKMKAKIIHLLGGLTREEVMIPAPIVKTTTCEIQTVTMEGTIPAFTRTGGAEIEKMIRTEVAHDLAKYMMEHDAILYERKTGDNNDLRISATIRYLQPNELVAED